MKKNWCLAGLLGLLAAVLYFASMAHYAFPGESADLMACWKGLDSSTALRYPWMALFVKALGGGNLLAPICGLIAVVSLFFLVTIFVDWRLAPNASTRRHTNLARIAGVVTALVFMLSPSVRSAATHLEPRLFDFTWMLLALVVAVSLFRRASGATVLVPVAFGAFVAFGFLDSALALAFQPFFIVILVLIALRRGMKPFLPVFLYGLSFLVTFLVAVWLLQLPLVECLRQSAKSWASYRQTPGWLFIFFFTTLPFVTVLFSSARVFTEKPRLSTWLFHGAMTFVSILAIATPLSPAALVEPYGILPVTTSAFAAAVAGYLVAFWWQNRTAVVGLVSGALFAFVLVVTMLWNLFSFDGDAGAFADKVARKIVNDLGTRRWLVTDGVLDSHVRLVAAEMGRKVNLISLARDLDERYLAELAELVKKEGVGGSKNGALQMSLSLGVLPFVQDWFASDPSVVKDVAVFGAPDLWYSAGLTSVPEFFFFGADEKIKPDWSVWAEFNSLLAAPKGWGSYRDRQVSNPVDRLRFFLRRHLGFVANNRGVYLQDKGLDDEAFKMYERVLNEIDRDNICAIFNEVNLAGQKHAGALAKQRELERQLKSVVEDKNRRYLLWRLSTYYGYIRNVDAFVRLGHLWARSGRPGDALSQVRRAIDFVPTDKRATLLNMMASLYASENEARKSRTLYETVLAKNAADHDALIGLMRLELVEGNTPKALDYLQRAIAAGADEKRLNLERAMALMMKNDLAGAKALIKRVTDGDPKNMQAWSLLATVTMQQIDEQKDPKARVAFEKELETSILPAMEHQARDQFDYYLQSVRGFLLLRKGADARRKAREAFIAAARARPDITTAHDMVLGLDISLDDKETAEVHAREALRRNRKAPLANYVMGSLALSRGKNEEAEAYLRKAADATPAVPLALNDLAEVLRREKKLTEAEHYARKAVEKTPGLYVVWETLGSVLMDANRNLDEAEAAIRKACDLSKGKDGREADVRMLVSLARVQLRNGDKLHAKVTIRKIRARIKELSDFERAEFEKLTHGLR